MLPIISTVCLLITLGYAVFVCWTAYQWEALDTWESQDEAVEEIEVILPCRQVESTIAATVKSIAANDIHAHITIVDDGSTDETIKVARSLKEEDLSVLSNPGKGRKQAIHTGIFRTDKSTIYLMDDTVMTTAESMRQHARCFQQEEADLVTGPVFIQPSKGLTYHFQQFHMLMTMGLKMVASDKQLFFSSPGNNLVFKRSFYQDIRPYQENFHLDIGADSFLIEKAIQQEASLMYIKNPDAFINIVGQTKMPQLFSLFGKSMQEVSHSRQPGISLVNLFIWLAFSCFAIMPLFMLIGFPLLFVGLCWLIKACVDFYFMQKIKRYYSIAYHPMYFPIVQILQPYVMLATSIRTILPANK